MGRIRNAGLGVGTSGSPQCDIMQETVDNKIEELISDIKLNDIKQETVNVKIDELTNNIKHFDSSKFDYDTSESKYDGYLFKLDHSDGGPKAKFLKEVLGYETGDGKLLHQEIGNAINNKYPDNIESTDFGVKYTFYTKIKGKNGIYEYANVIVVVQNDNDKTTWRLITLYPGKKDKQEEC